MNTNRVTVKPSGSPFSRLSLAQQLVLIVLCLGVAGVVVLYWSKPDVPNGHIPEDFPHTWLAPQDDGHPDKVVIIRCRDEPPPPVEQNGVKLFQAYQCLNEKCPGRSDGQPFVFAHWDQRPCPRCKTTDPNYLQRFETPEGAIIVAEIRRSFGH